MSTKLASAPYFVLQQTAVTTNVTSEVTKILHRDNISYEIVWSNGASTPLGTFTVEVQNDVTDPWMALNFGTAIALTGNSGSHGVSVTEMSFANIRVSYTATQGQVDLSISVVTKKIGG